MLVYLMICHLVELVLLESCMNLIQILWNVPNRAMNSSMLILKVMRRLTCWLMMLILMRMLCATMQMGDFVHSFL